ncbi:MAG TPA: glycosyltransferase family 9 protein [Bacteroidia bacterium]|nr:glycosyltransferase family 9 protein [Bacteroidia bacterium]
MKKILVVRFSSIGDIVLTTPVVRALANAGIEVHYLTKENFAGILAFNPHVNKVIAIREKVSEAKETLLRENYDFIVDLHHNLRSWQVKRLLGKPFASFPKLNFEKWLLVYARINLLPAKHIVDRYFDAVKTLGVINDGKGLDYFIPAADEISIQTLPPSHRNGFVAVTAGAKFNTKQFPTDKLIRIIKRQPLPVILLGGKTDQHRAREIEKECGDLVFDACGKFNLNQSASLIRQSAYVIAHDTGLMHIAAAFQKRLISAWGNTVPEFGMYPYQPGEGSKIIEYKNLYCRPCSKLGYNHCPQGHFRCMRDLDEGEFI